jgi:hypothetical protein
MVFRRARIGILLPAVLGLCVGSCAQPPADRQQAPRESSRSAAPTVSPSLDPAEQGLSDLARISRYVFREMRLREAACRGSTSLPGRVAYTLVVDVEGGKVTGASIGSAEIEQAGVGTALSEDRWPQGLVEKVDCLRPYLTRMEMAPAPADGRYRARFAIGPSAEPPPPERVPPSRPTTFDPHEAGLPDITRMARYVFREMHLRSETCGQPNPFPEPLEYTLRAEVRGGAVSRLTLTGATLVGGEEDRPLPEAQWPDGLRRYATCLEIYVTALKMSPAPGDGSYDLDYTALASR